MMNSANASAATAKTKWPDPLTAPQPERVAWLLAEFWRRLAGLADLLNRQEHLLADQLTSDLRNIVIEMMLALNGIQWPPATRHLNTYLGASQQLALQKTLALPQVSTESWIGRAIALVVIYRWYAPQLVTRFGVEQPAALEAATLAQLQQSVPDWPLSITTD